MRILEITAFIALSGALHAATLAVAPLQSGGTSDGPDGEADVTVQAATPTLAAMVQDWERAPEVSEAPNLMTPKAAFAPDRPRQDAPVSQQPHAIALAPPSPAPELPQAETRLPAPPVPLAQTTPDTLPVPMAQETDAPDVPASAHSRPRLTAPAPFEMAETAPTSPRIDTTPPVSRTAPIASLRPELRPDRPAPRAAPKPKQTQSASRPKQTAKGSGASQAASPAPAAKAPAPRGPSKAQLAGLEQQWGAQITSALRRAHRPPRGAKGTVKLVIAITPTGRVSGVSIAASSGNSRLDQAALAAVKRARFPRAPKGLTKSSYRFSQRLTVAR
ncbi:TonB family protein [Marivita sp.]|uniref:energy transducer TonB n=1 Tax=Marivita sp. TaxID=2003365 RepID=UPI003F6A704D